MHFQFLLNYFGTIDEYVRAEYVFGASAQWFWLLGILLWHIEQVAEKEGSFGFTKLTLKLYYEFIHT
ncbi:hypothetical protein L3X38_044167 [Prunus dulcis]|uniref:Uncharacterized protein n=1 Tax=Prunus dulcis TaxID=3755 RepID=A0AAD4YMV4_PRUDU|nr:hypothetical protein L3X38_044167 [Prunus dulcis]